MLDNATTEEMRYVFLHELAHLKRHDIYLGWLTSLLQVLHWLNPLVWFAFYRMRADRELACDALVLTRTGQDKSQEYGGAIVELVRRFSRSRPLPAMAGIIESKSQLKRRIAMITKFKNKSYRFSPLAVLMIVILASICLPNAMRTKASEAAASQPVNQPKFTKIRIPNRIHYDAQLSPDGQSIAFVSEKKLWIMPRSSRLGPDYPGAPRLLDTVGVEVAWSGIAWSVDGRWIAFNGREVNEGNQRIYVISTEGGAPRQVHENNRDVRAVNYRMSLSPHGETLAFSSVDANEVHIYTLPVEGGSPKRLVEAQAREPVFSPDGKTIAYVEDKDLGRRGGGLWTVPADGGTPTLVAEAGNASSPVWSPDGCMIAFIDYGADSQVYIVSVGGDGRPAGEKFRIDLPEGTKGAVCLTGWTPNNVIGALLGAQMEFALYTQPLQGGKATFVTHGAYPVQPRWSPDGKRVYHTNKTNAMSGDWTRYAIAYVPVAGGDVKTVPIKSKQKIRLWAYGAGNHVSADGKTIVFAGQKPQEGPNMMHIWTIPIDGGEPRQLTDAPAAFRDWYPCWSPDGKNIAFVRMEPRENWAVIAKANIYVISAEGGEPRQVTSELDRVFAASPVLWSPNGKLLSYFSRDKDDAGVGTIKIISPDGGEPRVVAKVEGIYANKEMAWSPDSKRIAYNALNNKIKIVTLDTGSIEEIKPDLKDIGIYHLDWSPDGENLVFGGSTGGGPEFWMMENFLPGTPVAELMTQPQFTKIRIPTMPQNGILSPDGKNLVFVSDESVWTVPLHGKVDPDIAGEPVRLADVPGIWDYWNLMAWSADGKWIAVNSGADANAVHVIPVAGGKPRRIQLPDRGGHVWSYRVSLSPNGQSLAFSALSIAPPLQASERRERYVYTIPTSGGEVKQVSLDGARMPSFSPDGRFVAYVGEGDLWIVPSSGGAPSKLTAVDGRLRGPVWSPDGKYIAAHHEPLGGNDSDEIWVFRLSSDASSAGEPVKIALPGNSGHVLAGWTPKNELGVFIESKIHTAIYKVASSGGRAMQVTPEGRPYYPTWSPDGQRIYFRWFFPKDDIGRVRDLLAGHETTAYVPASGGSPVRMPPVQSEGGLGVLIPGGGHKISPDGTRIVISAANGPSWNPQKGLDIWTVPVDDGLATRLTNDTSRESYPCWSPDGEWIAFVGSHVKSDNEEFKAIYIIPAKGGKTRQVSSEMDTVGDGAIAFSPDGERIAFFSEGSIKTVPLKGGQAEVLVNKVRSGRHSQLAYSPDGSRIANNAEGKIWITRLGGGRPEELQTGLPKDAKLDGLDWSPDGEKIVFVGTIGGDSEFWLIDNFLPDQME
jgi:Tol biopolymer transport system component